jgi:hypothetical protein
MLLFAKCFDHHGLAYSTKLLIESLKNNRMAITLLLSIAVSNAQIKNAKNGKNVKILGNCGTNQN